MDTAANRMQYGWGADRQDMVAMEITQTTRLLGIPDHVFMLQISLDVKLSTLIPLVLYNIGETPERC